MSAWADAQAKGKDTSLSLSGGRDFGAGVLVLFVAQVLSAYMGVYTETTYARFGRHWRQTLFWSHVWGLVFSVAMTPVLVQQFSRLWNSDAGTSLLPPIIANAHALQSAPVQVLSKLAPPQGIQLLLLNALTQVACISGVNRLSAQTTAVTVTVVLNIRKLVSFMVSCVLFGNEMSGMAALGASIVFGAGAVYGWDSSRRKQRVVDDKFENEAQEKKGQ